MSTSSPIERSALYTALGIAFFFGLAIVMTILLPNRSDPTWVRPSSHYQVQMYTVADPHTYISRASTGAQDLEYVLHLERDVSLLAFRESPSLGIVAPPELEELITRAEDATLKLCTRILFLREPERSESFDAIAAAETKRKREGVPRKVLELYDPGLSEAFSLIQAEGFLEEYADREYEIIGGPKQPWHEDPGVIYTLNPKEYRIRRFRFGGQVVYRYDPLGQRVESLADLTGAQLQFRSRELLIRDGEHYYAIEGCWYCHTDQSRTLIQDSVLNGTGSFAAPPSTANEYIYQKVTFPGTRRIGPDLSRTGVKRSSRDWHKSHFWAPKTESPGSIMPAFRHFFDNDPSGQAYSPMGVPNDRFEAIFQYLMTKGTRITPPTQAWWLGKDPIQTTLIIEGKKRVESKEPARG